MNYDAIKNVFGADLTADIQERMEQYQSMDWSQKQILTLCEGYPADTSTEAFSQADKLNDQGWFCHTAGKYDQALELYRQALELCPDFPMVCNNKGLSNFRLGRFDDAKAAYEETIRLNPIFIKPYSNMGILYYELKHDEEEAAAWFRKALALDPNYQRAREYMARIKGGSEGPDVLFIGADPDMAGGLIQEFQKMGKRVGVINHPFT